VGEAGDAVVEGEKRQKSLRGMTVLANNPKGYSQKQNQNQMRKR